MKWENTEGEKEEGDTLFGGGDKKRPIKDTTDIMRIVDCKMTELHPVVEEHSGQRN